MISVLLVNQVPENQRSLRRLLSSSGNTFKLDCASSYREILDGFRSKAYDVCVIDSEMEAGLKLFAQARSLGWTAPIVMVASNDAGEALRAIRMGVADCLIRDQLSLAGIEYSLCAVVDQARSISLQNQRERRYLSLLDNANQIVYTHDLTGAMLSINRTGEQLLGYSQTEILGMYVWQLVVPEYQILMTDMIALALDAQAQVGNEVDLVTRHGRGLLVEINIHPINHDGQTIEIQGIASARASLTDDGPWNYQGLGQSSPYVKPPGNQVLSLQPY